METKKFCKSEVMWTPKSDSGTRMNEFKKILEMKYKVKFNDFWDLHRWSVENFPEFWEEIWNFSGIIFSKKFDKVVDRNARCEDLPKWFEGSRLNTAENLLKYRDDHTALIVAGEERVPGKVTFAQMYQKACEYSAAFRKCGLKKGDRVVCYMSNREEPVFAMLGATSIGAIWSGALPSLGATAVLNRFKQIMPKVLITMDRYLNDGEEKEMLQKVQEIANGLPSLEKIIIVPSRENRLQKDISHIKNSCSLEEFLALGRNKDGSIPEIEFEQLPFDHPVFISYTSGTTGTPKAIIHGIGALLSISRDIQLHNDSSRENVWLSMSPVGWVTWNIFASLLHVGITVVLFDGVPYFLSPTYFWDMVDEFKISNLFLTPSVLDDLENKKYLPTSKHSLNSLKSIIGATSVVKPQNYDFVYKKIKPDVIFGSTYGSTEFMGACMLLDRTLPVYRGEITVPALGVDICCYDESGKSVMGEVGEMVVRTPSPSLPLSLWGDNDGKRFRENYCSKFEGHFSPGDICLINPMTKGIIVYGRSDDTLKPKGTRFGSSEIYNVVEVFEEVWDTLCVSQYNASRDERAVLFIRMRNGYKFDKELEQRLRKAIEDELSHHHIPEVILEVPDIPYNMNGKKMEILVKKIINRLPHNTDMVKNQECLEYYCNIPELQGY